MSEYTFGWVLGFIVGGVLGFLIGGVLGLETGAWNTMKEAYERDMAVQCLGKTGYYWECVE